MEKKELSVHITTWNVGNAEPSKKLNECIPQGLYDIYAIGVQECAYPPKAPYPTALDDWTGRIEKHLGEDYVPVSSFSITPYSTNTYVTPESFRQAVSQGKAKPGEIRIGIYIRLDYLDLLSDIGEGHKTTGRLEGLSGNKGGLGVTFKLGHTRFCFITAHLNAHDSEVKRRNEDAWNILNALTHQSFSSSVEDEFSFGSHSPTSSSTFSFSSSSATTRSFAYNIEASQSHYTFFFGDLNYRIGHPLEETIELIQHQDWRYLLEKDQLLEEQKKGNVLCNFKEPNIDFAPTFKVVREKVEFEYNTSRIPSYCDRILYKTFPGLPITPVFYKAIPQITTSDHKPVCALFNTTIYLLSQLERTTLSKMNRPTYKLKFENITVTNLNQDAKSVAGPKASIVVDAYFEVANEKTVYSSSPVSFKNPDSSLVWKGKALQVFMKLTEHLLFYSFVVLSVRDVGGVEKIGEVVLPISQFELKKSSKISLDMYQRGLLSATFSANVTLKEIL